MGMIDRCDSCIISDVNTNNYIYHLNMKLEETDSGNEDFREFIFVKILLLSYGRSLPAILVA